MNRWRIAVVSSVVIALAMVFTSALVFQFQGPLHSLAARSSFPGRHLRSFPPLQRGGWGILAISLGSLISQYLVGIIALFLFPRQLRLMADSLRSGYASLLRYFAIGLLLMVALAALAILSALNIPTSPLPFILLAFLFMVAFIGLVSVAYQLGGGLARRGGWTHLHPLANLALGMLILFALTRVPYIGGVLLLIIWLTGAGVAVASRFGTGTPWSLELLKEGEDR